eukprot:5116528-Prorocentrum_lima.AAC.1
MGIETQYHIGLNPERLHPTTTHIAPYTPREVFQLVEQRHNAVQHMDSYGVHNLYGTRYQHVTRNPNAHLTNPWHRLSSNQH